MRMESFELTPSPIERPEREMSIEELREELEYLRQHVGIDPLTGAFNRFRFDPKLEQSLKLIRGDIEQHRAGVEPLSEISLIMLDLDYFKKVNDTFGHSTGDEVLRKVSALLMDSVRETDMVARYGGEEFMIFLRGADEMVAADHAEKLRAKIEQMMFDTQPELKITASFGVVSSKSSTDAETLKKLVDSALYKAKSGSRNRVEVHTENEHEPLPTTSE